MKYSIIVPIYKVEKYVEQCVDSIINQTYQDIEIILVDDCSPDNCPAICDKYAQKDSRVKVIHKKNEGLLNARKSGLQAASGDYVCFVDGDDYIAPDMYEKVNLFVEKYNPDCVITQFYYAYEDINEESDYLLNKDFYSKNDIENELFPKMLFAGEYFKFGIYPCCWTKVFKREIVEKHLYFADGRIRMGEDIAFTYPCLMECNSIAFVDEPLYYYRQNPQSMTASYDKLLPEIYHLPYEAVKKASVEQGVDLSNQLPYYLLYLINFVVRNEINFNNPKSKSETMSVFKQLVEYADREDLNNSLDYSLLPLHTKMLAFCLKSNNPKYVYLYSRLLKGFIK